MGETPSGDHDPTSGGAHAPDVMDLLADHVPLALLVDLVTPEGPASEEILRAEGTPGDAWWVPDAGAASGPSEARPDAERLEGE